MIDLKPYNVEVGTVDGTGGKNLSGVPTIYQIAGLNLEQNKTFESDLETLDDERIPVPFATRTDVPDGVTMEQLIAICIHRLESFQSNTLANKYNDQVINHLYQALTMCEVRANL